MCDGIFQVACEIRFLKEHRSGTGSVDDILAVSACDDHGDLSGLENFRHCAARPSLQIHVEDSQIECALRRESLRLLEIACQESDFPAKLRQHFLQFEQDDCLILYNEHRSFVMICTIAVQIDLSGTQVKLRRLSGVPRQTQELKDFQVVYQG